jgi:3-oxoacyl-[acyl-carrier-protein] synthase-3
MKEVYITRISKFLPNDPVDNDTMETRLGYINGQMSKARRIVLRNNKIVSRYYAIDEKGQITHSNAELTNEAILNLCDADFTAKEIELLSCGTCTADQMLPSHAAMVHGLLQNNLLEINSSTGACCSGMNALKYGYMAVKCGDVENAVCTGSERASASMIGTKYEEEVDYLAALDEKPIIAFSKDFLRWMLSDGAGAFLLQNKPIGELSLKIEWMEGFSYAHEMETCMYMGGDKLDDGSIKGWSDFSPEMWAKQSIFALKQDTKLLGNNILIKGVNSLKRAIDKNNINTTDIDYYLPHISSYYFKEGLYNEMKNQNIDIPYEKWYMNLDKVGNVGSASIYLMLEELANSGSLKKGQTILLSVPESARFSFSYAYLTVC